MSRLRFPSAFAFNVAVLTPYALLKRFKSMYKPLIPFYVSADVSALLCAFVFERVLAMPTPPVKLNHSFN